MSIEKWVGVVVPVRNRIERTQRFLEQFSRQDHPHYRLYFVDSNSTDGTRAWLEQIKGPRLTWIEAGDEDYWTGATNRGIEQALRDGCEFALTINDDSVPSTDLLSRLLKAQAAHDHDILGSRVNFFEKPSLVWSTGSYNVWGSHKLFQLFDNEVEEEKIAHYLGVNHIKDVYLMCGNGVLIHRRVFEKIGLYDELNCPHYHADSEFVMRAVANGLRCGIAYDAVVYNDTTGYRATNGFVPPRDPPWVLESAPYIGQPVRWLKKVDRLFIKKRSEKRIRTVSYIIRRYGAPGTKTASHIRYFGFFFGAYLIHPRVKHGWRQAARWIKRTWASEGKANILAHQGRKIAHRLYRKAYTALFGHQRDYPLH